MKVGAVTALVLVALLSAGATVADGSPHRFRDCAACPEMTILPPGSFMMGSPPDEPGRYEDEGPQRRVTIRGPLAIGTGPVTHAEFRTFVAETGHPVGEDWAAPFEAVHPPGDADPTVRVTWEDAVAYVGWLARRTGRPYRLPSEAEWEYAARGGRSTAFPWGDAADPDLANAGQPACCHGGTTAADRWHYTSPVGAFPPNDFGLFDMVGNVHQWVADCWRADYEGLGEDPAPVEPADACTYRVVRGASWVRPPSTLRVAMRNGLTPTTASPDLGFRVAVTLDAPALPPPFR